MGDTELDGTRAQGAAPAAAGPAGGRLRFRRGLSEFHSEIAAYLRERLLLVTGFMGIAAGVLWVVGRVADLANHGWEGSDFLHPSVLVHGAACLVAFLLHGLLRRRAPSPAGLLAADGTVVAVAVATCVLVLAFSYRTGARQIVPILGLFLIARAVVVPSPASRTFWMSAPAAPLVLALQLHHGEVFVAEGAAVPADRFVSWVVWDQAVLWLSVAVATLTSRVNFALRLRAWEARQVDRYTLEGRIGSGAMGEVYRARHGLLRRPTALKVLRPEIGGEDTLRRFEEEVRQTARLTHPNTVAIYDYGTTPEGVFYYAMELLDGADLQRLVEETGPMPAARAIHVLVQVCGALEEAHGAGLIHRDVKPANIMLCRRGGVDDVAKVMDFGLVKDLKGPAGPGDTAAGTFSGTPLTMAPETLRGAPPAPGVDIYALGAVGCWMVTGKPIFDADTTSAYLMAHLNEEPVPPTRREPSVPSDLEACLLRCLRKDPAERFPSVRALREALQSCADAGPWTPDPITEGGTG